MSTIHEIGYDMDGNLHPTFWTPTEGKQKFDIPVACDAAISRLLGDPRVSFNLTAGLPTPPTCHDHEDRVHG